MLQLMMTLSVVVLIVASHQKGMKKKKEGESL